MGRYTLRFDVCLEFYPSQCGFTETTFTITENYECGGSNTLTASTVPPIIVQLGSPVAFYPSTGPAFAEFTDYYSNSIGDLLYCPKRYYASYAYDLNWNPLLPSIYDLKTFSFNEATKQFKIEAD